VGNGIEWIRDLSMKIGIAILGAGRWGIHLGRIFAGHPHAQLKAIVDPDRARLTFCQEKLGLDSSKTVLASSWEEIKDLEGLNAIAIVTPASTHKDTILEALARNYHVFSEKPLTLNPLECQELSVLAAAKQKILFIDHTYLFNDYVAKGAEIAQSSQLGTWRYGYANRTHLGPVRQDVDALWDLAIHDIAIFNYWLGKYPIAVEAIGKVWLQPDKQLEISSRRGLADLVWVTLTYEDGFQAYIHLCWCNHDKQRKLSLVGSHGTLIFDEMSKEGTLVLQKGYFSREDEKFIPTEEGREIVVVEAKETLSTVCDRFLENIQSKRTDELASPQTATRLVQILTCLTQSLDRDGQRIEIDYSL
jgi:predicted dehydrogenase